MTTVAETCEQRAAQFASAALSDVLKRLDASIHGLSSGQASMRLATVGPNSVRTHSVSALAVLRRQLNNAVLALLAATAVLSYFLGDSTQAVIIGIILLASIGLGFLNEYRAERATAALHSRIHHTAVVCRDGQFQRLDVNALVPGDVIRLELGELVPADVRLINVNGLECNESILTGESVPAEKSAEPAVLGAELLEAANLAFMGTIVSAGEATAVVYATGAQAEFGRMAAGLGERQPETAFQLGLRKFSYLLLRVALTLAVVIIVTSLLLRRPIIDSALFGLAIAVGITPQLLPAVVSASLSSGSRQLARLKVLVKRLVCIEDLGDMDILITDKTGTLTEGRITLDGRDLREWSQAALHRRIGVIFQDFMRYEMTARENIAVGRIEIEHTQGEIEYAAHKSLADGVIARLHGGYDQMLGRRFESGVDLSGGEWQKLALARAYLRDAQLLILDEPTASLDARSELEVFSRFAELTLDKMALLISHRFSTVRMADRIVVLENGHLVEEGNHDRLIALGGRYAAMFEMQAASYR